MENGSRLTEKVDDLAVTVKKQEQYLWRRCLLPHGIPLKEARKY